MINIVRHGDDYENAEEPKAIYIRDVMSLLVGKEIKVNIKGNVPQVWGTLKAFNGSVLQVIDEERITYIHYENVASISEDL